MCRGKRSQQHSKKFITLKNNQPNKRGNSIFHVENEYLVLFIPENVITICLNWLPKHKPLRIFTAGIYWLLYLLVPFRRVVRGNKQSLKNDATM